MEEKPFPDLKIASSSFLEKLHGREKCPKCGKSRKYYCYNCFRPLPGVQDKIPRVKLPVKIDIIKHPSEVDGKSTAVHAAVLAREDVTIYTYPVIPEYEDNSKVVLVYPGEGALTLEEYVLRHCSPVSAENGEGSFKDPKPESPPRRIMGENGNSLQKYESISKHAETESQEKATDDPAAGLNLCADSRNILASETQNSVVSESDSLSLTNVDNSKKPECGKRAFDENSSTCDKRKKPRGLSAKYRCPFDRVVFIDSTWHQVYKIKTDDRLKGLQRIELKTKETKFWRHQKDKPSSYLATIEAIYYFLREYHEYFVNAEYNGDYDNLLFFFCFMYGKLRELYEGGKELKAYKQKQQ